jgi:hypothetical protein
MRRYELRRFLKRNAVIAGIAGNSGYLAQKRWRDLRFYADSSPVNADRLGKPLEPATYRFGSFAGQDCGELSRVAVLEF